MRQIWKIGSLACVLALQSSWALAAQPGIWGGAGGNSVGQLGANTTTNSFTSPTAMYSAAGPLQDKAILEVDAGFDHACAITEDLALTCWGSDSDGELGNGATTGDSIVPVAVTVGASLKVSHVDTGFETSCAIATDGTAWCWGANNLGQLGLGSRASGNADIVSPTQVAGTGGGTTTLTNTIDLSVADSHGCAVADPSASTKPTSGNVYCWGANTSGQLGTANNTDSPNVPVQIVTNTTTCPNGPASGTKFTNVHTSKGNANSRGTSCALTTTGELYCWGLNAKGELGNNTTTDSNCPVKVLNLPTSPGVLDIEMSSGSNTGTNCVIASGTLSSTTYNRRVFCWGDRSAGRVGNGAPTTGESLTPVPITSTDSFERLSVGSDHVCGVTTTGLAYCWGGNNGGEFGSGTTLPTNATPVAAGTGGSLFSGTSFTNISTGADFTIFAADAGGPGLELKPSTFQMMGLPCPPPTAVGGDTVQNLFGTNSPNNFRDACLFNNSSTDSCVGSGWRMWDFNRSNSAAAGTYGNLDLPNSLTDLTNEGYWINAIKLPATGRLYSRCKRTETKPVANFNGAACSSVNGCMAVDIGRLWAGNTYNQVGNPLPYNVDWSSVRVCLGRGGTTAASTCTTSYTPAEAQTANVMSQSMSFWDGTSWASFNSVSNNGNIGYFRSFFVNVLPSAPSTLSLLIPLQRSSLSGPTSFAAASSLSTSTTSRSGSSGATIQTVSSPSSVWTTKFRVWEDARRIEHNNVVVGRMNGGTNGPDALDTSYLPPASNNFLYVTVPHSDWGNRNGEYSTDIRSPVKTTTSWPVTIKSSVPNSTVRFWMQASNGDVLRKCRLIDNKTGTSYNPNLPSVRNNGITLKLDKVVTMNVAGSDMQAGTRELTWRCSGI